MIHSIDVTLDRTEQSLLTDSLNGNTPISRKGGSFIALLNGVFFHRVFGNVQPLTRDIFDVTFVPLA